MDMKEKIEKAAKAIQDMAAITDVKIICQSWISDSMEKLIKKLELDNVEICPVCNVLPKNIVAAIMDKNYKGD